MLDKMWYVVDAFKRWIVDLGHISSHVNQQMLE